VKLTKRAASRRCRAVVDAADFPFCEKAMNANATKYMDAVVIHMSSAACPMVEGAVALLHEVGCLVKSCADDVPSIKSPFTSSVPLTFVCSLSHCCNNGWPV
jgi:hypothetical protein